MVKTREEIFKELENQSEKLTDLIKRDISLKANRKEKPMLQETTLTTWSTTSNWLRKTATATRS